MVSIEEIKAEKPTSTLIDQIPGIEQQRIIRESGILNKSINSEKPLDRMQKFAISIISGFLLSCMQLFLEQLVHQQFVQDTDQSLVFKRWPTVALAWGMVVQLTTGQFSDGYLLISHIISAYYSISIFSKDFPTYGETLSLAPVICLCAYSSFQVSIKPLTVALLIEFILYFAVIKSSASYLVSFNLLFVFPLPRDFSNLLTQLFH